MAVPTAPLVQMKFASSMVDSSRLRLIRAEQLMTVARIIWDSSRARATINHSGIWWHGRPKPFPSEYSKGYARKKAVALKTNVARPDTLLSGHMWDYPSMGTKVVEIGTDMELSVFFRGSTALKESKAKNTDTFRGLLLYSRRYPSAAKAINICRKWDTLLIGVDDGALRKIKVVIDRSITEVAKNLPLKEVTI